MSAGLERQELALIEAREGKSRRWHLHNLAITARAALNAMPRDPNATDVTAFSNAIAADAERAFEQAPKAPQHTRQEIAQDLVTNSVRCAKTSRKERPRHGFPGCRRLLQRPRAVAEFVAELRAA
ncbi:MAG: hypothetical protein WAK55_34120 [Xanthobacteraceae bacterium]